MTVKRTNQTPILTGYVEKLPYYLYIVELYRISKNRANVISTRYYISNKELEVSEVKVLKKFRNFSIERFITLLGSPDIN